MACAPSENICPVWSELDFVPAFICGSYSCQTFLNQTNHLYNVQEKHLPYQHSVFMFIFLEIVLSELWQLGYIYIWYYVWFYFLNCYQTFLLPVTYLSGSCFLLFKINFYCGGNMSLYMTKPTNDLCPQQRLRSAWSLLSSLSTWRRFGLELPKKVHNDFDQTGWMPRLIWIFWEHRSFLLV